MLSLLPRSHTPQSSRGGKQSPELGELRQSQEKVSPGAKGLRGGVTTLLPTPGQHPESHLRAPSTPAAPPHTLSLSSPHTRLGKFQQWCRPRASKPSPLPLPSLFSLPETCSVISRKPLLEPEAKKVWEKAQSSFPSALLLSTPSQHSQQSPTGQTYTGQTVARLCPLALKVSALRHCCGQAKGVEQISERSHHWMAFPRITSKFHFLCTHSSPEGGPVSPRGTCQPPSLQLQTQTRELQLPPLKPHQTC